MKEPTALTLRRYWTLFFGPTVEFRVKLLNAAAIIGIVASGISGTLNAVYGYGYQAIAMSFGTTLSCAAMLWYMTRSGNHKFGAAFMIAVLTALCPAYFYSMGETEGYNTETTLFFAFVILFTTVILKGKRMIAVCAAQMVLCSAVIIHGYRLPDADTLTPEFIYRIKWDVAMSMWISIGTLVAVLAMFFRLYDKQTRALEDARRQAEDAHRRAEELSKMRSDIFTRMSHEMRTPLSVMSTYAQLAVGNLRRGVVTPETVSDLTTVSGEAERLSDMADGALKILTSSFDPSAAPEDLDMEPVDIGELAGKVVGLVRHAVVDGRPKIDLDINESTGMMIGDSGVLMQMFWNLLSNAVAHSGAENITLRVRDSVDNDFMTIEVEDNGNGIPPDLLPRIFEKGVSGAGSSGIGLAVCKDIAEWHGGNIKIDSELNKGTRVTVTLNRDANAD